MDDVFHRLAFDNKRIDCTGKGAALFRLVRVRIDLAQVRRLDIAT
jgi:hypothetical protein